MVLTAQLRRRLNYHEQRTQSSVWAINSATDYSGIVMSYTAKVAIMLLLLCVDLGFNSSVDHDSPAGTEGAMDETALTFAMVYFGAQVSLSEYFCACVCTRASVFLVFLLSALLYSCTISPHTPTDTSPPLSLSFFLDASAWMSTLLISVGIATFNLHDLLTNFYSMPHLETSPCTKHNSHATSLLLDRGPNFSFCYVFSIALRHISLSGWSHRCAE